MYPVSLFSALRMHRNLVVLGLLLRHCHPDLNVINTAKKHIHLLQCHLFGFGNKEPNKYEQADVACYEEEKGFSDIKQG